MTSNGFMLNQAQSSSDFTSSIGVNTHLNWSGPWANWSNVEAELAYVGVSNVRDGVPYAGFDLSEYERLAAQGIKFDIIISEPTINVSADLSNIDTFVAAAHGSVASIEGANEFNTNSYTFNGQNSYNNPNWGAQVDSALSAGVQGDSKLAGTTVVASSFANAGPSQIAAEGNLDAVVGASNWHEYFAQGQQPGPGIANAVAEARSMAPSKPVIITESGYYTAVDATGWGGSGVNQDAQAKMTLNLLFDAFKNGASKTYLYELMDDATNPSSSDLEDSFGLFNGNGTPKPAATALHNLTSILADKATGATASKPGTLGYNLNGLNSQDNSMLLEKSSGTFDLVLWNEQSIWNVASRTELAPTSHAITLNLAQSAQVSVYDPILGASSEQTIGATNQVQLTMSADPLIVEIKATEQADLACFATGTLIDTQTGLVAVEKLKVGERVLTASGQNRPVLWIGHRTLARTDLCASSGRWPVRISAGAFGQGLPERDLFLSPGHPVLVGGDDIGEGGLLVPIMCLINGTTIAYNEVHEVTYWHIELDAHDLVLAEGLPVESFFRPGNPTWFENDGGARISDRDAVTGVRCRPVATFGPLIEAERHRIDRLFAAQLVEACAWPVTQNCLLA